MGRNWLQFIAVEWTQRKDSELLKVSSRFEILAGHSNQVIQLILTLENWNFAIFGLLIILALKFLLSVQNCVLVWMSNLKFKS